MELPTEKTTGFLRIGKKLNNLMLIYELDFLLISVGGLTGESVATSRWPGTKTTNVESQQLQASQLCKRCLCKSCIYRDIAAGTLNIIIITSNYAPGISIEHVGKYGM